MPSTLPFELPLPSDGRLIGSSTRAVASAATGATTGESINVIVDVPDGPAEVVAFYEDALTARGWYFRGGFPWSDTTPGGPPPGNTLCLSEDGPSLGFIVVPNGAGWSEVRFSIVTTPENLCNNRPSGRRRSRSNDSRTREARWRNFWS